MNKIIIAGGSGMIGERLTELLTARGDHVVILSRSERQSKRSKVRYRKWDIAKGEFPEDELTDADYVLNFAGANIGGKRWTKSYKEEILDSRRDSTSLLVKVLNKGNHKVKAFYSTSASGYYGYDRKDTLHEDAAPADNYLANVCKIWEEEAHKLQARDTRLVILRIGIVLSTKGGALKELAKPVQLMAGAPLGDGKQYVPWIHIDDICRMIIYSLDNKEINGIYNAGGPVPVTNSMLTHAIAHQLHKPLILPPIPGFALKMIVGEMAGSLTGSVKLSVDKIMKAGFHFEHPEITAALENLYTHNL